MPFNGSGLFTRVYRWVNDRNAGIPITATRFDAEDDDFAAGFNNTVTRDGQGVPTANIPWGNFKITNLADATQPKDAMNLESVQGNKAVYMGTAGGTANAITLGGANAPTSLYDGQTFIFKVLATNTGAATLNIGGLGALPILKASQPLTGGELVAGQFVEVFYDQTSNAFQLFGGTTAAASGSSLSGAQYQMVRFSAASTPQAENAPYDLCFSTPDATVYTASQTIVRHAPVHPMLLPASLTGSRAGCVAAPTGSIAITLAKNGTSIGTINIAAAATTATFTFTTQTSFAVTDVLTIVAPASADATLAGVYASLLGQRQ